MIYLSLHCHHQNDSCIKMGSDESHFNVSVGSDGQSHKTVSTNHNPFEEKGEPMRYRTEIRHSGVMCSIGCASLIRSLARWCQLSLRQTCFNCEGSCEWGGVGSEGEVHVAER